MEATMQLRNVHAKGSNDLTSTRRFGRTGAVLRSTLTMIFVMTMLIGCDTLEPSMDTLEDPTNTEGPASLEPENASGVASPSFATASSWSGWSKLPGGGLTDAAPTATGYSVSELYVFIKGLDKEVWVNKL